MGFVAGRGPQAVSAINYITSGTSFANPTTLASVDIGAAHPLRKVVVFVTSLSQVLETSITSLTIGGISATLRGYQIRHTQAPAWGSYVWCYELDVPAGTTSTISMTFHQLQGTFFYAVYTVVGGAFQNNIMTTPPVATTSTQSVSLPANAGLISLVYHGDAGGSPGDVTWSGANRDADTGISVNIAGPKGGRASVARRLVTAPTGSFNLTSTWNSALPFINDTNHVTLVYS